MGKVGTGKRGLGGMWVVPENLRGNTFQGLSPLNPNAVSATDRCVEAFLGLSIHRSPVPISSQLPSTSDFPVCGLSTKCPAAKPSVSRYHLGRAHSEQLDSSWDTFDAWFELQLEANCPRLLTRFIYEDVLSIGIEVLLPSVRVGGERCTHLLRKMACDKPSGQRPKEALNPRQGPG